MVFFNGLNHGLNQWFKPFGLNQPTLPNTTTCRTIASTVNIKKKQQSQLA